MFKKRKLTTAVSAVLASGLIVTGMATVMAADKVAREPAKTMQADRNLDKASNNVMLSMRDVNDARVALFNGDSEAARTHIDAAEMRINAAVGEAQTYAHELKKGEQDDWYIPYDTSLAVVDTFQPSNTRTVMNNDKANTANHQQGQKSQEQQFKLDEEDISVSAGLVPVKYAQRQIARAAEFASKGDYYQANLALKAVDDAVTIQTYAIDDTADDSATVTDATG